MNVSQKTRLRRVFERTLCVLPRAARSWQTYTSHKTKEGLYETFFCFTEKNVFLRKPWRFEQIPIFVNHGKKEASEHFDMQGTQEGTQKPKISICSNNFLNYLINNRCLICRLKSPNHSSVSVYKKLGKIPLYVRIVLVIGILFLVHFLHGRSQWMTGIKPGKSLL